MFVRCFFYFPYKNKFVSSVTSLDIGKSTKRFISVIAPIDKSERSHEISELTVAPKNEEKQYAHIKAEIAALGALRYFKLEVQSCIQHTIVAKPKHTTQMHRKYAAALPIPASKAATVIII